MRTAVGMAGALTLGLTASAARAGTTTPMTLHGFCGTTAGATTCFDNGNITPTTQNPISPFGFTRSPDDNTKLTAPLTFDLVFLVPNNDSVTFGAFTGTNTAVASATPSLFPGGTWTTGDLLDFLKETQTGGPNNPIGAYLPLTQLPGIDPTAAGYNVYQANFGSVPLFATGTGADPFWTDATTLPAGTVILGLIECASVVTGDKHCPAPTAPNTNSVAEDATANSGALFESTPGVVFPPVPEPGSLALLGTALTALGLIRRRRKPV